MLIANVHNRQSKVCKILQTPQACKTALLLERIGKKVGWIVTWSTQSLIDLLLIAEVNWGEICLNL